MPTSSGDSTVTGEVIAEAEFDPKIANHGRSLVSLIMAATIVGIPFIPIAFLISRWYFTRYLQRISLRLTTNAVETRKGVFFRQEATIPLNRITDVALHDGPLMRHYGLRGLRIETAGGGGESAEGDMIGVIDAAEMRDAILRQRDAVQETRASGTPTPWAATNASSDILVEIRDILARIEEQGRSS